jgi:mono/diheme cytochrome c family protein
MATMTRSTTALLVLALGLGLATVARSGDAPAPGAAALPGEALYRERTCIACHGADART